MFDSVHQLFPAFEEVVGEAEAALSQLPLEKLAEVGIMRPIDNYYLVGTYPPLKAMDEVDAAKFLPGISATASVYLHVPFCEQRCTFCHFAKEILPRQERVTRYLNALRRELELVTALSGRPTARTVYFGGGTPSYLAAAQLEALFSALRGAVRVPAETEVTFELHPSVVDAPDYEDRLDALAEAGVNRWVFGVQSMDDQVLRKLNRGHDTEAVHRLLGMLRDRDADNVSVDLIFGLPYQTPKNWYETIRELVEAGVEKFNIFPLMFKQADPISAHYRTNPGIFPDGRERLLMHFMTESIMRRLGYRRGPLFYYARAESHSRQQEDKYDSIEDVNLLPFGVSGFGYVNNTQYYNECTMDGYMSAVEEGRPAVWRGAYLSREERMRRTVMFALRSGGVHLSDFRERYGADPLEHFAAELAPYFTYGLVEEAGAYLRVTDRGAPFADSIALQLASAQVQARVRDANTRIIDLKRDPLDRFDYSPIERAPVAASVSPLPWPRADGRSRTTQQKPAR